MIHTPHDTNTDFTGWTPIAHKFRGSVNDALDEVLECIDWLELHSSSKRYSFNQYAMCWWLEDVKDALFFYLKWSDRLMEPERQDWKKEFLSR